MSSSSDWDISRNLGIHRVIEPAGLLPQAAWKLDNTPVAQFAETLALYALDALDDRQELAELELLEQEGPASS